MVLLEVRNLNLWYGDVHALKGVSFSLRRGEILCVVGESGSGKSSILYSIMGLLPEGARLEGEILVEGVNLIDMDEERRRLIRGKDISMIFQEPSAYLDPLFTVGVQIGETLMAHGERGNLGERVTEAMRRAGIPKPEEKVNLYPHQLSGGLKQRVCIASAIICGPKIILADEPTTALDVSIQKRILNLFRKIKGEGRSVILVTHDFGVVAEVGDRVLVLKEGRVVEEGDVESIFDSPKDDYTRMLLSAI
ncbi:MAG: ABC transporter ATP-binding protein [Aquificota bacterium]|nr:ABC transporter ATP-binding protein [Aquificota bacterium]